VSTTEWLLEDARVLPLEAVYLIDDNHWHEPNVKRLICPLCDSTYQDLSGGAVIVDGEDEYGDGWGGRGPLLMLPACGECGHLWDICFGFHKGETFVFVRVREGQ